MTDCHPGNQSSLSSAKTCACNPIPSDQRHQPECDGDGYRIRRSNCDGISYWLMFFLDLFLDSNQVLMVSALCWSPLFSYDRWCRCITLYQKKKRATVRSLTYRCNWSQVRSMTVMLSLFFSLSFCLIDKVKYDKDAVSPADMIRLELQPSSESRLLSVSVNFSK